MPSNKYEFVFLARQDIQTSQVDAITEEFTKTVEELGGKVAKVEYWGLKTIAYRIKKNRKAHYVLMNLDAPAASIAEIERRARLHDDLIRYMTVRVEALEDGPSAMMRSREKDGRRGGKGGHQQRRHG